jgi:hypothetical protein
MSDPWAAWEGARTAPPLAAVAAALPAAESIPPRAWLYGRRLVRGFVSVLAAPGGVGKSVLALGQAVALASGQPILGETVHHSVPVWLLNLEDPQDEIDRRLAACLRLHKLPDAAVQGRLYLHAGRTRPVCMAALAAGGGITYPDRDAVAAATRARGIGLIVVDPFVKSHALDENSNPHMDAAATAWAGVAEECGAAVLLVHHVRKLGGTAMDVEAARGAKALTDAARCAAVLGPMSPEEADRLGVVPAERWRHVRLDDAKANLAPRAEQAMWYRLEGVKLGNGTADYPHGDTVAALTPWQPPSAFIDISVEVANAALDEIAAGPQPGVLFAATKQGGVAAERWAGVVLRRLGLAEATAARVIATWLRNGVLKEESYRDPVHRKQRHGVRVVESKRPIIVTTRGANDAS